MLFRSQLVSMLVPEGVGISRCSIAAMSTTCTSRTRAGSVHAPADSAGEVATAFAASSLEIASPAISACTSARYEP